MRREELSSLVERYQNAKDNGRLQNASEATMRTWIDELLSLFDWDVQNTQQILTEHSLGRAERARLHEIGSTNVRPDYTLVNGNVQKVFLLMWRMTEVLLSKSDHTDGQSVPLSPS